MFMVAQSVLKTNLKNRLFLSAGLRYTINMTTDEKIKAEEVFDIPNNIDTFISFSVDEPETALLWLRRKMDKL